MGVCDAKIENAGDQIIIENDPETLKFSSTLFSELKNYKKNKDGDYKIGGRSTVLKGLRLSTVTETAKNTYKVDFSIRTNTTSGNATLQFGKLSSDNPDIEVAVTPENKNTDKVGKMNAQLGKAGLIFNIMMNATDQKASVLDKKATIGQFIEKLDELKTGPIANFVDDSFWLDNTKKDAIKKLFEEAAQDSKKAEAAANYKNALINIINFFIRINAYLQEDKQNKPEDLFNNLLIALYRCAKGITKYNLPCLDLY